MPRGKWRIFWWRVWNQHVHLRQATDIKLISLLLLHLTRRLWTHNYNNNKNGSRPTLFFSADPIIFSTPLTVRPYFLRVVAGCYQNGVCCHTKYWKNHEKNIQKKNYFRPTGPNFFARWNWNHRYFFLRPTLTWPKLLFWFNIK